MATIPEEYADFDFGFSAVDDEEYKAKTTEVEKKIVEVEAKSESLTNLEKKIDSAINEINYKKEYLEEKFVNIVIQINGKKKSLIKTEKNLDEKVLLENVKKDKKISNFLEKKRIFKHIIVKNKLVNLIIK